MILGFVFRLLVFLAYLIASLVVLFWTSDGETKDKLCRVQLTYHQDFLVNVMSNPFFSSLGLLRDAPLSKLERKYYHSANFSQNVSSIFAFPATIYDAHQKAAFLPVYPNPASTMVAAGETIPLGSSAGLHDFFYDSQVKIVVFQVENVIHSNNLVLCRTGWSGPMGRFPR